ncbi:MAG: hypothetical protein ACK5NK_12175 [Niabella sp.]
MKKNEIPQDDGYLGRIAKEVTYVIDENGKYVTGQSSGWNVKSEANDVAWESFEKQIQDAKEKVLKGEVSPVFYWMEKRMMDIGIVAQYTGQWKWTVKRHLKPAGFKTLSDKKLKKYAEVFEISIQELQHPFTK